MSEAKTERECVEFMEARIQAAGYRPLEEYIAAGKRLRQGDKVYRVNMKKGIVLFNLGSDELENGMNILGAHIDSPRLDIKSNPLYEDGGFALLDTHYYGGIKNTSGSHCPWLSTAFLSGRMVRSSRLPSGKNRKIRSSSSRICSSIWRRSR